MAKMQASVVLNLIDSVDSFPIRKFALKGGSKMTIGRASSSRSNNRPGPERDNAFFDSPVVSRLHAELSYDPTTLCVFIEDIESMHGTTINGRKISARTRERLYTGDIVGIGSSIMQGDKAYPGRTFKMAYVVESQRATNPTEDLSKSQIKPARSVVPGEPAVFVVPDSSSEDSVCDSSDPEEIEDPYSEEEPEFLEQFSQSSKPDNSPTLEQAVRDKNVAKSTSKTCVEVTSILEDEYDREPIARDASFWDTVYHVVDACDGTGKTNDDEQQRKSPELSPIRSQIQKEAAVPERSEDEYEDVGAEEDEPAGEPMPSKSSLDEAADDLVMLSCAAAAVQDVGSPHIGNIDLGSRREPPAGSLEKYTVTGAGNGDSISLTKAFSAFDPRPSTNQPSWHGISEDNGVFGASQDQRQASANLKCLATKDRSTDAEAFEIWEDFSNKGPLNGIQPFTVHKEPHHQEIPSSAFEDPKPDLWKFWNRSFEQPRPSALPSSTQYHAYYPVNGISQGPYPTLPKFSTGSSLPFIGPYAQTEACGGAHKVQNSTPIAHKSSITQRKIDPSLYKVSIPNIVDPPPYTNPAGTKRNFTEISTNDSVESEAATVYTFPKEQQAPAPITVEKVAASDTEAVVPKMVSSGVQKASQTFFVDDRSNAPVEPPQKRARTSESSVASASRVGTFMLGALVGGIGAIGALVSLPESFF